MISSFSIFLYKEVFDMKMSKETEMFISKLKKVERFSKIVDVIMSDLNKFEVDITNDVLGGVVHLDGRWTDYILSDINITYEEDVLKIKDLLDMYGISETLNLPLTAESKGLIMSYQYSLLDALGNDMDVVNLFHVTLSDPNNNYTKWCLG